jgi:hypothetical protein
MRQSRDVGRRFLSSMGTEEKLVLGGVDLQQLIAAGAVDARSPQLSPRSGAATTLRSWGQTLLVDGVDHDVLAFFCRLDVRRGMSATLLSVLRAVNL